MQEKLNRSPSETTLKLPTLDLKQNVLKPVPKFTIVVVLDLLLFGRGREGRWQGYSNLRAWAVCIYLNLRVRCFLKMVNFLLIGITKCWLLNSCFFVCLFVFL